MMPRPFIRAVGWLSICLAISWPTYSEDKFLDRVGTVFENIGQGLSTVGRKAEKVIGPGLGFGEKTDSSFTFTRRFDERYPVGSAPVIDIANEFGEIRVETWANEVVQVIADISVGADSTDDAKKLAEAIDIAVTPSNGRLEVRTRFPDSRPEGGNVFMTVNYSLIVPADSSLSAENFFGDTFVRGLGGPIGIQSEFGIVDIRDAASPVQVRARGPFAVDVYNLRQGGSFELNGSRAVFDGVDGVLKAENFAGSIEIRNPAEHAQFDIGNESGPITLRLPQGVKPDLAATCLFGEIASDVTLSRSVQGQVTLARTDNIESGQRIALRASFGNIQISQEGAPAVPAPSIIQDTLPFKDTIATSLTVAEGTELVVDAIPGEITIEGEDQDAVTVSATRYVRMRGEGNAPAALEALVVNAQLENGRAHVTTAVIGDMEPLGCASFRVDLTIRCPRTCPLTVQAQEGQTIVRGMGDAVRIVQSAGNVAAEHVKGILTVENKRGNVTLSQCAGPVEATASFGDIALTEIYGAVKATGEQSKIVLEALASSAVVRNRGGDVRVLALAGVQGDYDIVVEQGNLSILLPADANTAIDVVTEAGMVYSQIPLNGSIGPNVQEFHGRLGDGSHRVVLRAKSGDVRIN